MTTFKTWSKPSPIIKKDNIISSDVVLKNHKPFVPSYIHECRENMWWIMNNGYMKQWFDEKTRFEHFTTARHDPVNNSLGVLKKKYIQRTKPIRIRELPIISLKQFSNIPGKVDTNLGLQHTELFE